MSTGPTTTNRKARERALADAFLRLSGCGALIERSAEAPDFILNTDTGSVGLEVTELHIENDGGKIAPTQRQSIVRDVVARALQRYQQLTSTPTYVSIQFSTSSRLLKLDRIDTARALADFVASNLPATGTSSEVRIPLQHPLQPTVQSVRIWAGTPVTRSQWTAPLAGWVSPLSQDIVQRAVDQKAARLPAYRARTSTVWLLVATAGDGPSQYFEPDPMFHPSSIVSPFDRTFLLCQFQGTVVELGR